MESIQTLPKMTFLYKAKISRRLLIFVLRGLAGMIWSALCELSVRNEKWIIIKKNKEKKKYVAQQRAYVTNKQGIF